MFEDKEILYREKEVDFIQNYLGPAGSFTYPCLFVYGHSSTGKSLVVSDVLRKSGTPYIWVNCYETYSPQLLFTSIVKQVYALLGDCGISEDKSCNNVCDLINTLKLLLGENEHTTVIVLDSAEALLNRKMSISYLVRLQELTGINISTIFISDVRWEKFREIAGLFEPIIHHFADYTKEQLVEILCLDCPTGHSVTFYRGYVDIILKVFFLVTRNVNELRHVALLNFSKYCEPITSGEANEHNIGKLYKNIEPTLRKAIHAVYLREVSGPKWDNMLKEDSDAAEVNDNTQSRNSKFHMVKELPFYSKFLLIASYLASYNLPKTDFKHFVKNQGKQAKKQKTKKSEKNRHLLGPKSFPLDRMLSIFSAIAGHKVLPSSLILSQISSLVSLHLICRVSMEEQLDSPKYKCLAELELVSSIGKTVNFDVSNYLDDFL